MSTKSILFITSDPDLETLLDESIQQSFRCVVAYPGKLPETPDDPSSFVLLVIGGYSLQEMLKLMPELEPLVLRLPEELPRLYLLHSTDPSLSLNPLKGEQKVFYLRGPLSLRALRNAVDQILGMKPRAVRFKLSPELGITANFRLPSIHPSRIFIKELLEISPRGFSFYWALEEPLIYPGDLLTDLTLMAHGRPFVSTAAQVKHLTPQQEHGKTEGLRIGVEFIETSTIEPPTTDGKSIAFLTDPMVIRTVMADAVERSTQCSLQNESQSWELQATMELANEGEQMVRLRVDNPIRLEDLNQYDILTCQFVRDNAQLQFSAVLAHISDDRLALTLRFPRRLDRLWARSTLRYSFPADRAPYVEIHTPIRPDMPIRRKVANLSPNGLSFWADPERDLVFRRMHLQRLELVLPNGPRLTLAAEVRYIGPQEEVQRTTNPSRKTRETTHSGPLPAGRESGAVQSAASGASDENKHSSGSSGTRVLPSHASDGSRTVQAAGAAQDVPSVVLVKETDGSARDSEESKASGWDSESDGYPIASTDGDGEETTSRSLSTGEPTAASETRQDRAAYVERIPCGIRFVNMPPDAHLQIVNYLIRKNFPQVRDAELQDEEPLWRFLELGEFYTPSKRDECLGSQAEVRLTQARMLHAPAYMSRKLLFRDKGQIFGTVSLQQVYSQTWLVHHLCAVRHPQEFVPKNLLLFLGEFISKTPEIRYIKMMWRPNNTWSNKMFGRLVHRLHDGEQSVVKAYSYLHRQAQELPPLHPEARRWDVRQIAPEEIIELESFFIRQEEFFLMKSEDLIRGKLGLTGLNSDYRALGLFRERHVLVAMEKGVLAGFALLERSSPGMNLSNLLSTCQIHICPTDPQTAHLLRQTLARAAVFHYQSLGQNRAILMTEDRELSAYESVGFKKVKEYVSWTFDHSITNIYNLYCYYIFRLYERLEAQRRARHQFYHPEQTSDA